MRRNNTKPFRRGTDVRVEIEYEHKVTRRFVRNENEENMLYYSYRTCTHVLEVKTSRCSASGSKACKPSCFGIVPLTHLRILHRESQFLRQHQADTSNAPQTQSQWVTQLVSVPVRATPSREASSRPATSLSALTSATTSSCIRSTFDLGLL